MKRWTMFALAISAVILAACNGAAADPTQETPTVEPTPAATTAAEPTTDPNAAGGGTTLALPDVEQAVKDALINGDFEAAAQLMSDPFTIGFFLSEGVTLTPIEAATQLTSTYKVPQCTLAFPEAPADLSARMGGTDPLTMWDPGVTIVDAVYSTGWGMTCEGEALLVFSQQADGSFRWYGALLAPDGFNADGTGAAGTPITTEDGGYDTLEGMQTIVKNGLTNDDFELLALAMTSPFNFGFWRSEGTSMTPIESAAALTGDYQGESCIITFPPTPDDISTRMDGVDPAAIWGPDVALEGAPLYSKGWGETCAGEAFLYFTQTDGVFAWYGILLAPGGFQ